MSINPEVRESTIRRAARVPNWLVVTFCAALGTVLPMGFGLLAGIPDPVIQDEYSFLLGADTFARGRLTNPSPQFPRFFESEHILVTPTYQSKYPPGQALFLAFGQVVLGHPIWGVWLSCGLFAATLVWMLNACISRPWSVATTVLMILTMGTSTYWAQSYWGGMLPASAAAFVFGGLRRTISRPSMHATVMMGIGLLLLANTRPYEGLYIAVPALCVLAWWLIANRSRAVRDRLIRVVLPLVFTVAFGVALTAAYNSAVTGKALVAPYQLHIQQYLFRGVFIFSPPQTPQRHPPERVEAFYRELAASQVLGFDAVKRLTVNIVSRLLLSVSAPFGLTMDGDVYRGVLLWLLVLPPIWQRLSLTKYVVLTLVTVVSELLICQFLPLYPWPLVPPVLTAILTVLQSRMPRTAWWRLIAGVAVLGIVGQALVQWWLPHYTATVFPLIFACMGSALWRYSAELRLSAIRKLPAVLTVLVLAQLLALTIAGLSLRASSGDAPATRESVQEALVKKGGSHLVFVAYDEQYTKHKEWVYNDADLPSTSVLFAHDLGDVDNRRLIESNPARRVWKLFVSSESVRLTPY